MRAALLLILSLLCLLGRAPRRARGEHALAGKLAWQASLNARIPWARLAGRQ